MTRPPTQPLGGRASQPRSFWCVAAPSVPDVLLLLCSFAQPAEVLAEEAEEALADRNRPPPVCTDLLPGQQRCSPPAEMGAPSVYNGRAVVIVLHVVGPAATSDLFGSLRISSDRATSCAGDLCQGPAQAWVPPGGRARPDADTLWSAGLQQGFPPQRVGYYRVAGGGGGGGGGRSRGVARARRHVARGP